MTHARPSLLRLVWRCLPYLLLAGLAWYEISAILAINQGKFTYSLDDPYIHLALAGQIARGNYGINAGELAAPSSSTLWPFLLAPLAWTPRFELVPLAYNLLIAAATVYVYTQFGIILLENPPGDPSQGSDSSAGVDFGTALAIPMIFATNLVGLAFTGMEHSLQVLLCAVVVLGVARVLRGQPAGWLPLALVAAPLMRYEALAVTLPALALLYLKGQRRTALLALGATAASLGAFSAFLYTHGLGWLPTSVYAKVGYADYRPTQNFILDHIRNNMTQTQGEVLGGLMLVLIWLAVARRGIPWSERALGLLAAAGVLVHLSAGQIGWMDRYEVYMVAAALLWTLYLTRGLLGWLFERLGALPLAALLLYGAQVVGQPYINDISLTPGAAANIYEQQYQMHRFAVDYLKAPIAVNDLGWPAYQNPYYVLDLWGLASPTALDRRTHAAPGQVEWMETLAQRHAVQLAMIYAGPQGWFPAQPAGWREVARLHLGHPQVSAGGDTVIFFVTQQSSHERVRGLLRDFAPTLPPGVKLEIID